MNTSPEDGNVFKEFEETHRRHLRWFQYFVWTGVVISVGMAMFLPRLHLPRPLGLALVVGPTLLMLLGVFGFLWWLVPQHPLVAQMRPAARRLCRQLAYAGLCYLAVLAAAQWFARAMHPAGIVAVLMALAPSLPILFVIRAMLLFRKEESDEFLRARLLEAWALATGLMLAVCTMWGFLDQFEVVPHLPLWAAFPIWVCCLVPAHLVLQRRDA